MIYRILFCLIVLSSCSKVDPNTDLPIQSDGENCNSEPSGFTCELLEVKDIQLINEDVYAWSPNILDYKEGDQIEFVNGNSSTFWKVTEAEHFIYEEKLGISCNENYELITYICQKNEIVNIKFLNDLLGPDLLSLELRSIVDNYEETTPGEKGHIISLRQDRNNSNIVNFWLRHKNERDYYSNNWSSYLEELSLNGVKYNDVLQYNLGENIWAEPYQVYYMSKGIGILGFEVDGKLWIRK